MFIIVYHTNLNHQVTTYDNVLLYYYVTFISINVKVVYNNLGYKQLYIPRWRIYITCGTLLARKSTLLYLIMSKFYLVSIYRYIVSVISWAPLSHRHDIPKAKIACEFLLIMILILLMSMSYDCNHTVLHIVDLTLTALFYLYLNIRVSERGITDRAIANSVSGWIKLHGIDIIALTHIFVANAILVHIGDIRVRVL